MLLQLPPGESITTGGEGGGLTTNDRYIYDKARQLRNHGFKDGTHQMTDLGFNFRMSEVQAAIASIQLQKLDGFIARRREIAIMYTRALHGVVRTPEYDRDSAWHLYAIRTPRRDELKETLAKRNIYCQVHYTPVHKQPYYDDGLHLPGAEAYAAECLSLPIYPSLTDSQVRKVIDAIKEALA